VQNHPVVALVWLDLPKKIRKGFPAPLKVGAPKFSKKSDVSKTRFDTFSTRFMKFPDPEKKFFFNGKILGT
jgi:hypothetical protein